MKSFALPTSTLIATVSLLSLVTIGTVRNIMIPGSQLRTETLIAQANYKEAIAHFNRGINYTQQEKLALAIAEYTRAIELDPNYALAYNNRADIYYQQQKHDLALADWNRAIEIDPLLAVAYINRGSLYYLQKKNDLALADFNTTIDLDPRFAEAYFIRGAIYYSRKETEKAIADLTTAAELFRQQGNTEMYNSAIEALRQIGA